MGSTEQKIEEQFAQLQQKVGARHAEVLKHSDGDQFPVEYARLVNVTSKLVEFEKTIPERLAEPDRRRSERIVTWSWRGQAAVAAVLIALVLILDRSTWWLVLCWARTSWERWPAASRRSMPNSTVTAASGPSDCTWSRS
ncbi:hypothetical protein OG889_40345 [Streptomyces sp. NBC_00481]|uniref:hypothetical protein n=1 Tax=Streptomyces sp. NBC_00481 TaxID=2975755 RepID=UPI002DDA83CA|nr:hypothetical protein [Streptomyces sp. NBC_00481]WRZ00387.1 hypothetical protein OG889_40345 [Streptomyces sp. NBC_00481]